MKKPFYILLLLSCDQTVHKAWAFTEVKRRLVRDLAMTSLLTGCKVAVDGDGSRHFRYFCVNRRLPAKVTHEAGLS